MYSMTFLFDPDRAETELTKESRATGLSTLTTKDQAQQRLLSLRVRRVRRSVKCTWFLLGTQTNLHQKSTNYI